MDVVEGDSEVVEEGVRPTAACHGSRSTKGRYWRRGDRGRRGCSRRGWSGKQRWQPEPMRLELPRGAPRRHGARAVAWNRWRRPWRGDAGEWWVPETHRRTPAAKLGLAAASRLRQSRVALVGIRCRRRARCRAGVRPRQELPAAAGAVAASRGRKGGWEGVAFDTDVKDKARGTVVRRWKFVGTASAGWWSRRGRAGRGCELWRSIGPPRWAVS
jgi:hypothetical protein